MSRKLTPKDIKSIEENFCLAFNDVPDDSGMVPHAFGYQWKLKALCEAAMETMTEQDTQAELTLEEIVEHRRRMWQLLPGADMDLCDKVCAAARAWIEQQSNFWARKDVPDEAAALAAQRETQGGPGPIPQDRGPSEQEEPDWFTSDGMAAPKPAPSPDAAARNEGEELVERMRCAAIEWPQGTSERAAWEASTATAEQWDALRQCLLQEGAAFIEQILERRG